MSKEWYEESSEAFAEGFTEECQVHHPQEQLEKTYGPSAPFSEHKRGDRVRYLSASGEERSGMIVWCQASTKDIQMKYVIAPDDGGFLDFALPSDVITQEQEPVLIDCPYCPGKHYDVNQCPLKPKEV